jgi:hypothetical protein
VVPENGEHISLRYLSKDNLSRSPYGDPVIEIQKGHPGGTSCEAESNEQLTAGFNGKQWWMDRLKDTRAEIKNTTDPKQRKLLEETVARCLAHIEELPNEQRTEVGGSRG